MFCNVSDFDDLVSVLELIYAIRALNLVINGGIFLFHISGTRFGCPFCLSLDELGRVEARTSTW